jgi:phosphopentomutase
VAVPVFSRAIVIVLDSVGIGELPDAAAYDDQGSNTLGNIARAVPLRVPTLVSLGLDKLVPALASTGGWRKHPPARIP